MKEFITIGYSYDELNEEAKARVEEWYLNDPIRNDLFYEDIKNDLKELFPNSALDVCYSLSYCQGDGLNIIGSLNMFDFIDKWDATPKEARRMYFYLQHVNHEFTFEKNNHYCYSCKFIDKKNIDSFIHEMYEDLNDRDFQDVNIITIRKFYTDFLNYFEALDKKYERDGYDYLYEVDAEEVREHCIANDYYFTGSGDFIS